ncbi:hypothetical protein Metbo_1384 [Methanobacterium lacus]|jgi:hypothetical protein|uniref:Uncharacterized protein n=1 Tax=Methanobacterium lacus (strain AL-21) TaxID=877455 RepID=F0T7Z8_METLA|nr:hypothetical protein [Methanobacterium lacus]ADZ09624.1 hypothetical protein Metbo_1384 [Methanobacterium lacus]
MRLRTSRQKLYIILIKNIIYGGIYITKESSLFNPIFLALISLAIPGVGYLLLGYEKKGLYFLFSYAFLWLGYKLLENDFLIVSFLFLIIVIIISIYAAYDTYQLAENN